MRRAHIVVSGLVQGVFFRSFVQENALKLGLKGFVRNLPSGEVEAVVEGYDEGIEKLIGKLKAGPPSARVENVDVKWQPYKGEFDGFRIIK